MCMRMKEMENIEKIYQLIHLNDSHFESFKFNEKKWNRNCMQSF